MYKMENNIFWKKLKYLYIVQGMSINDFSNWMNIDINTIKSFATTPVDKYPDEYLCRIYVFLNHFYGKALYDKNNDSYEKQIASDLMYQVVDISLRNHGIELIVKQDTSVDDKKTRG